MWIWLKPRGLVFNEDKTTIVHLTKGFEFLGLHIRRYPNGKLLIKPSPRRSSGSNGDSRPGCAACAART